jgi:hypothetical protein
MLFSERERLFLKKLVFKVPLILILFIKHLLYFLFFTLLWLKSYYNY